MNEFITTLKYVIYKHGGHGNISSIDLGSGLNNYFVGTKLKGTGKRYFVPKELMLEFLR